MTLAEHDDHDRAELVEATALLCHRVVVAALAYVDGTYPDDHPLDVELRDAVEALREFTVRA